MSQKNQGIQLRASSLSGNVQQPYERRSRASSLIVTNFRTVGDQIKNHAAADQSRRASRISRGLNPDAPRPSQMKREPINQNQAKQQKAKQKANEIEKMDQHKIPLQQLCFRFGTNLESGLSNQAALKRNLEEGDNKLPQKAKTPAWIRFLKQITNWFAIMLWVGSILCIVVYIIQPQGNVSDVYLAVVLMFVVLLTGTITFNQNAKSQAMMEGFKNMLPSQAKVLREGKVTQIAAEKLVRGDVIEIISGEKIPADIRVVQSNQMKVDNSALTGQVQPLLRSTQCTHPQQPFETKNLAFFGTMCKEGRGKGIVINIGGKTIMGQIADLASTGGVAKTPLRIQLDRFVFLITAIALTLGVVFFLLALLVVKYNALQCLIFGIGILVANVPQGLLACITISLAITAARLAERQVLVKNLEAVETLGSTSCICSDKTGTLTQNKMTVQNLWYDGNVVRGASRQIKGPDFQYEYDIQDPSFKMLHHTAMICSEAKFDVTEQQIKAPDFKYANATVLGDASQTALVKFYQPIQDINKTRALYQPGRNKDGSQSKMPFNSTNKFALSIIREQGPDHHYVVYIKGAPEKIWSFCGRILVEGRFKTIGPEQKKSFNDVNLRFGKNGQRVLGFARLPLNKQTYVPDYQFVTSKIDNFNFPMENFIFVGLISLMDPPKESVPFAIKKCQSAGIKVIMVTGDQPPTAAAIAKQIGIIKFKTNEDLKQQGYTAQAALEKANAIVIHGDMITKAFQEGQEIGNQILTTWVKKPEIVFARTTPAQKLLIVTACQTVGHVVGVTGDGVNDSPAIKQGDIGISMGISGSDVTKDAADMILLNDDFSSIVDGIEEGRKIFDNLKKTVVYLLTSNMTEIWPFIALVIIQIPLPLSNIFMLCICVGTDIYPALSLAYQVAQVDIMTRKPRKLTDHLVSGRLLAHAYGQMGQIATAGGFFTYFVIMNLYGYNFNVIFFLLSIPCVVPLNTYTNGTAYNDTFYTGHYTYNPNLITGGAPIPANCNNALFSTGFPNWVSDINSAYDTRGAYLKCDTSTGNYQQVFDASWYNQDLLNTISPITNLPVKYTTQSIFYAQSGYFVTVVMIQWSNVFACKSRKTSLIYSAFNKHMIGGVLTQTVLFIFLLYVPGVNSVFGGRPLDFFILGIPGLGFSMTLLCWEQSRKALMNMDTNNGKPNWWARNLLW